MSGAVFGLKSSLREGALEGRGGAFPVGADREELFPGCRDGFWKGKAR